MEKYYRARQATDVKMDHAHFILDTQSREIYFYLFEPMGLSIRQHVAQSNITGYARSTLHAAGSGSFLFAPRRVITVEQLSVN